jgi:hypothetical protein
MFLIRSVPPNSYIAMANILRSFFFAFSPDAYTQNLPSGKMTKILQQLFAVLRLDLFSQSLLDLCDIKTEIVATSHSAWPLEP